MFLPERIASLSSSQRRFSCIALSIPQGSSDTAILERALEMGLSGDNLLSVIAFARKEHQARADKIDPQFLVGDLPNLPTLNNLLKEFSNAELTRLAYKLRFERTYASRLFIAQRIESLALRHHLTIKHLRLILMRKRRIPHALDDDTQTTEIVPGMLDTKT